MSLKHILPHTTTAIALALAGTAFAESQADSTAKAAGEIASGCRAG